MSFLRRTANLPAILAAWLAALTLLLALPAWSATPAVIDDAGHRLLLDAPAQRIISLAPHATELLFAAGAGTRIVGVSEFSDYPPQAKQITSIGSAAAVDLERIVALKPDLVIAWRSGNSAAQVARLRNLGLAVFESEPRDFAAIAANIERLAQLAGTETAGRAAAQAFRARLDSLAARHAQSTPVRVFYQIWDKPLMTLNDQHMASAVLRLCGGQNVFGGLKQLAPTVGIEDVVRADPEVIIGGTGAENNDVSSWRRFPKMTAVSRGNLMAANPDLFARPGPRVVDGAEQICRLLDNARSRRP